MERDENQRVKTTRKKVKLEWVMNENSRTISLKKRRLGLLKKVKELTILCDVKACLIMFSPNEAEPMAWPSLDTAYDHLDDFFALPEIDQKKKETTLESYLKEKTKKVEEKLKKDRKKNLDYVADNLMKQIHRGRRIDDLNLTEIYGLLSFSKDKILNLRRRLGFMQHLPLRDPPVNPVEMRTTTNDVFMTGDHDQDGGGRRINIGVENENRSHYFMDKWFFPSSESSKFQINQESEMETAPYNENLGHKRYLAYQGSSSNGNPNLEMKPICEPEMTFHGWFGPFSQPRQNSYDFMNGDVGVREEGRNVNNGDLQFQWWNNTETTGNDGQLRHVPPPNGATGGEEGNIDATSFDINRVLREINKHRQF